MEDVNKTGPDEVKADIREHFAKVQEYMNTVSNTIRFRGGMHDQSKWNSKELLLLIELVPRLKEIPFGTGEYLACIEEMKPALEHHYSRNSHHPEHYKERGVNGMNLVDLIEMLCDWKAASERKENGNIYESIAFNAKRFNISEQLVDVLNNTALLLFAK